MALPAAHAAVAFGMTRHRALHVLLFLAFLSVLPDFDFLMVWNWGDPQFSYHRTWSHSLIFTALFSTLWGLFRPSYFKEISPLLVFWVLASHSLLDMLCTARATDHGVAILWPFSDIRFGWPVLVPLYLKFANSPFSLAGALRFTALEVLLAGPLFFVTGIIRILCHRLLVHVRFLTWRAGRTWSLGR